MIDQGFQKFNQAVQQLLTLKPHDLRDARTFVDNQLREATATRDPERRAKLEAAAERNREIVEAATTLVEIATRAIQSKKVVPVGVGGGDEGDED